MLLWFSTIADWYVARGLSRAESQRTKNGLLALSLSLNLGLLGFFKYSGFLLENLQLVASTFGVAYKPPELDIVLPVGISFYTFQTLSYTLDVYRGKTRPWHSFLDYALYVTFFPQLVAGPIVRATDFLPQLERIRRASLAELSWGLSLLVLGLFEKVFIADMLMAPVVDEVFKKAVPLRMIEAWAGTLAFTTQIFCDFAGYSLCAVGVAMCLGFALPDNFRFPYAAIGFSDFWRRWHMSLSTWLRDYLYIALGGNRVSTVRTYINLMLTMLIGGLWHGASWTFVVWGGLHGLYLVIERLLKQRFAGDMGRVGRAFGWALTTVGVCFAWVFFRAPTFAGAAAIIRGLVGATPNAKSLLTTDDLRWSFLAFSAVTTMHLILRQTTLEDAAARVPWWIRSVILTVLLFALFSAQGDDRAFIYFQF